MNSNSWLSERPETQLLVKTTMRSLQERKWNWNVKHERRTCNAERFSYGTYKDQRRWNCRDHFGKLEGRMQKALSIFLLLRSLTSGSYLPLKIMFYNYALLLNEENVWMIQLSVTWIIEVANDSLAFQKSWTLLFIETAPFWLSFFFFGQMMRNAPFNLYFFLTD